MFIFEKEKSCCFSGNRELGFDFNKEELEIKIKEIINRGYKFFLCGMAVGFDLECFLVLKKLRKKYKIKIIACVPCVGQEKKYSEEEKKLYRKCLKESDEVITLSEHYYNGCMHVRNNYMVDNSSVLICYNRKNYGGTYYTLKYAIKNNLEIIKL